MILSDDLLLNSILRRSQASIDFQNLTPFVELRRRLDSITEPTTLRILDTTQGIFDNTTWLEDSLIFLIDKFRIDPLYLPPLGGGRFGEDAKVTMSVVPIFKHPLMFVTTQTFAFDWNISKETQKTRLVTFGGHPGLVKVISSGSAKFSRWSCPPLNDDLDLAQPFICSEIPGFTIRKEDAAVFVDRSNTAVNIDAVDGFVTVLQITANTPSASFAVVYDLKSNSISRVSPSARQTARTAAYLAALRSMSFRARAGILHDLSRHPSFFVRWSAIRELVHLEGPGAHIALDTFIKSETNPMVSRAAKKMNEMINQIVEDSK